MFDPARKNDRDRDTVRDWVAANITLGKGLSGAKPAEFSLWLFDLLGAEPSDEFDDLYIGTGAVTRAWESWCKSRNNEPEQLTMQI